jgi:hypothetical protein
VSRDDAVCSTWAIVISQRGRRARQQPRSWAEVHCIWCTQACTTRLENKHMRRGHGFVGCRVACVNTRPAEDDVSACRWQGRWGGEAQARGTPRRTVVFLLKRRRSMVKRHGRGWLVGSRQCSAVGVVGGGGGVVPGVLLRARLKAAGGDASGRTGEKRRAS